MDNPSKKNATFPKNRRQFLTYLMGGTAGTLTLGWLFPQLVESEDLNLENLCTSFPDNSRCQDYLPGVRAVDSQGNPIAPNTVTPEHPFPAEGLSKITYLVIQENSKTPMYGIRPVCTHLGCTVEWKSDVNRFICPCHGSEYDLIGRVEKGPANKPLPLVTVIIKQDQIREPMLDPRFPSR
jgi:cytochrome b6-f complex iron-sulfur subunit